MRLDVYLVENGTCESRQKAKYLIDGGMVFLNGIPCLKASADVSGKTVDVRGEGIPYVSRGGLKLEGALRQFALSVDGLTALDVGASTGGFTDCLLQNGAARVYAVDAGSNQLHKKLRDDARVISMENCNARSLSRESIPEEISFAVMDVSFISQTLLYEPLLRVLREDATVVTLIKPQFEVGKGDIGKGGIVKKSEAHLRILQELTAFAAGKGLYCKGLAVSPISGGDGNREYLGVFTRNEKDRICPTTTDLKRLVNEGAAILYRTKTGKELGSP